MFFFGGQRVVGGMGRCCSGVAVGFDEEVGSGDRFRVGIGAGVNVEEGKEILGFRM